MESTKTLGTYHHTEIFYNTSVKAGSGGRAFRFEKNESGVYSWNEITDKDTLAALEQVAAADKKADAAQDTANSKKRVFVDTPDRDSVYDIGDLWVSAVYDDGTIIYKNDSLVCITAKVEGEAFSISHWKPSSAATTAYLENLGNQIVIAVTDSEKGIGEAKRLAEQGIADAYDAAQSALDALGIAQDAQGKADKNTAAIVVTNDSIAAFVEGVHFDCNGNITNINTSGLVTTANLSLLYGKEIIYDKNGHVDMTKMSGLVTEAGFAQMFSRQATADGYVTQGDIKLFITEDDAGRLISNAVIKADNINFEGSTVKISADNIDFEGSTVIINAENIELNGNVIAEAIKLDGLNINDKFVVYSDGRVDMTGKFATSVGGARIEIDPANKEIVMYNVNGYVTGKLGFDSYSGSLAESAKLELYELDTDGDIRVESIYSPGHIAMHRYSTPRDPNNTTINTPATSVSITPTGISFMINGTWGNHISNTN